MRCSRRFHMSMWDNPAFEHSPLTRFWKRMMNESGTTLTSNSIPRHIHGYLEGTNTRTEALLRWFPYKQEMTVNGRHVPTFKDVLYTHYFPRELNDDERVKYVSIKTGRSELEVAEEIYLMRKIKLFSAQLLRNKLRGKNFRQPEGMDYSGIERRYSMGLSLAAQSMGMSMYGTSTTEPLLMYSPQHDFGDCVDVVATKQLRTSQQYLLCDVVVHRGIPRARLPHIRDDPKEPLAAIEPCMHQYLKLRLAVLSLIAKKEQYVTDHRYDGNHRYGGCLVHLYPSPMDPEVVDHTLEPIELDLELAEEWMRHYYEHQIAPRRTHQP